MTKLTPNTSRVISLNGLGRNRSPGQRILVECRDQLVFGLCHWLQDVASVVAEELFVLADSTRERPQQTRYLDLRADIEKDWQHLIETFRRELSAEAERCVDRILQEENARELPLEIPDFEGLQLMDDSDLSEHIVIREFSAQLAESCDDELYALNRRVAALLARTEQTDAQNNPLGPGVICRALSDSCATISNDGESRLILLRRLERHLHIVLPTIYQGINAYLIERGILPDLRRSYRRTAAASALRSDSAATPIPQSSPEHAAAEPAPTDPGDGILAALRRIAMARSAQNQLALVPKFADGESSPDASSTAGTMQSGALAFEGTAISDILKASLNARQHIPTQATGGVIINQVRQVRDSGDARYANGLEAVTMDIVAMLFDLIFDDDRIPLAIKALISRLQIPVLKVAMLNPDFFADRQHPTRRFLSSISGISIRWGSAVDESDPFYQKLSALVDRIQDEFEEDVQIFGAAVDELDAFVGEREEEEANTALVAANVVIQNEMQAEAWEQAHQAVRSFLQRLPQPLVLERFLNEHWGAALQKIRVNASPSVEQEWASACQVMHDLAWSITPKKTSDERLKLIGLLPGLLAAINKGLDSIDASAPQRTGFFDALVKCHSAALKGESLQHKAETRAATPAVSAPPSEGDLLVTRRIDNGIQVEEITLVGATPVWNSGESEIFRQVNELKRGHWVEFVGEDGNTHRERLNWISPQRGILLFSNHRSAKAISIAPEALARQIRNGKAAIVGEEAIFDRALHGAIESISTELA